MSSNSDLYTTVKLPGEPITRVTLHEGYDLARDLPASSLEAVTLLDQQDAPVFHIVDLTAVELDVEQIIHGANITSGAENSLYRHPMVQEVLFVSEDVIVQLGAKGLDSEAFGQVKARVFSTPEEALAYAREQITKP